MPTKTHSKRYIAATNLAGEFKKGDEVPHGARLRQLLAFGDRFVIEDVPARKGATESPDVDPVDENKEK